jgi:murein DD-endopeptidase MepM/ murein hydrolase activator NlpD
VVHTFDPPAVRWGSGHRGVDLAGQMGQPVRAALAGRVAFVGRIAGVGVVVVDHGTTRTTYQPVAAAVQRGDEVATGTVVGRLEWLGTHCLPAACLHWGLLRGDRYLDPLGLVGGGPRPVRLLPPGEPLLGAPG